MITTGVLSDDRASQATMTSLRCGQRTARTPSDFFGVPATGRQVSGGAVSFFQLRYGKVVEYLVVVDQYPLLQQMGVLQG